jgi:hypothetical protein
MTVGLATAGAGSQVLGAIVSFEPLGPDVAGWNSHGSGALDRAGSLRYSPSSTGRYLNVCIDPDVIYEIQGDSVGAIVATEISENADLVAGSGSVVSGYSGWEMNSATNATTLNLQLHILRAVDRPDNDVTLVNADFEVLLNMSVFTGALGRVVGV